MFDWLTGRFKEPLRIDPAAAHETFQEEHADTISAAEDRGTELQEEVASVLADLDAALAGLQGYEDVEDRTVVEDVVDNIASDRRRLIEEFDTDQDPARLAEELDAFVDEFTRMKRKESEVLDVIGGDKDPVFEALEEVRTVKEQVTRFQNGKYQVLERRDRLADLCSELQDLQEEREAVRAELDGIDLAASRQRIEEIEAELDDLHGSEAWTEYERLQDDRAEAVENAEQARRRVTAAVKQMQRGLKKLLYSPDNRETGVEERDILEAVRDGEVDTVLAADADRVAAAAASARDALPNDLLDDRQQQKFLDAADTLTDFAALQQRVAAAQEEVEELEQRIASHEAPARENELTAALDDAGQELDEKRQRRKQLR
ncbi:MAG: hypothetical protein SVW77_03000 [Candidatus Nanohaloarchaea archaeon]|nr:hypothetical protein [Candidatus Nanohaloarchaea archaeon]